MQQKKEIKDFIGVYDNYITPQACDSMINFFEKEKKLKKAIDRQTSEGTSLLNKKDEAVFLNEGNVEDWAGRHQDFFINVDLAIKDYDKATGLSEAINSGLHYTTFKIQKTLPAGGYHLWHVEQVPVNEMVMRALVFSVYLNTVEEGGETEFLHQKQRVKPVKGRIVIWPASFPYLHRGNPPLSGEKYILTSWMRSGFNGFKGF